MRVVLDTNVFISAMLFELSPPGQVVELWRKQRFTVITGPDQIQEIQRVTRYPKIKDRLPRSLAGRMVNDLLGVTIMIDRPAIVDVSKDPADNRILGIAVAGQADFLVTGDARDLLVHDSVCGVKIISVRHFLKMFE